MKMTRLCASILLTGLIVFISLIGLAISPVRSAYAAVAVVHKVPHLAASNASAAAVADFNGDGYDDLALGDDPTLSAKTSGLQIFITQNNHKSTVRKYFPTAHMSPADSSPFAVSVVAADFNGDNHPDLAVIYQAYGYSWLTISINDGNGNFSNDMTYPGDLYSKVVVGDFNGDGHPDLAVLNILNNKESIVILTNKGDGTFSSATSYTINHIVDMLSAADFNKDGYTDLALLTHSDSGKDSLRILMNKKDGSFAPSAPSIVGSGPSSMLVGGDFNGDGNIDIAIDHLQQSKISILNGKGDGTFTQTSGYAGDGSSSSMLVAGNFSQGGCLDLALARDGSKSIQVLRNSKGTSTFVPERSYESFGLLVVGDFDGDKHPDLAVIDYNTITLQVLRPNPDLAISNQSLAGNSFLVGQQVESTLIINNSGQNGAVEKGKSIVVTDNIPAGLQQIMAQGKDWQICLSGTETTTTSSVKMIATYTGAYPLASGAVLPPITVNGVLTKDAVPLFTTTAQVKVSNDSNLDNNISVNSIFVKNH